MIKAEMQRIDREMNEADQRLSVCRELYDKLVDHLANLEHFIASVAAVYRQGDAYVRRQVNQALFEELLVTADGVEDATTTTLLNGLVPLPTQRG